MSSALEWERVFATMPRCWGRRLLPGAVRVMGKVWADASAWAADTLRISSPVVASMTTGAVLSAVRPCCRAQVQWRGGHIHGRPPLASASRNLAVGPANRRLQGLGRFQRNGHPQRAGAPAARPV